MSEESNAFIESILPEGWDFDYMGLDSNFVCPHGTTIEMDGRCPDGCVSPMITAGMI